MILGIRTALAALVLAATSGLAQQQAKETREQPPRLSVPAGQLQRPAVIDVRPLVKSRTLSDEAYREILERHRARTAVRANRHTATAVTRLASQNTDYRGTRDCDDRNATVYPGARESCDGLDNNCGGDVDEGLTSTFYLDADGDGWGDGSRTCLACSRPDGYAARANDCDDRNLRINPTAPDEPRNGVDENCNGEYG